METTHKAQYLRQTSAATAIRQVTCIMPARARLPTDKLNGFLGSRVGRRSNRNPYLIICTQGIREHLKDMSASNNSCP